MSTAEPSRQIVLTALPEDRLSTECFRLEEIPRPSPREGEVLLKALYITLDASNRAYKMQAWTYAAALKAGDVMYGRALAEVTESRADGFAPGELVFAEMGWRDWAAMPARLLQKRPRTQPLTHQLSVYGNSGLTAYHGLLNCGRPQPGETVVVSAAGGAVGTLVGRGDRQDRRGQGCRHRRRRGEVRAADPRAWLPRGGRPPLAGDFREALR